MTEEELTNMIRGIILSGFYGKESEQWMANKIVDILHEAGVKKSREEILADIDRDFWLEPKEAIDYGLADEIMTKEIWEGMIK